MKDSKSRRPCRPYLVQALKGDAYTGTVRIVTRDTAGSVGLVGSRLLLGLLGFSRIGLGLGLGFEILTTGSV